VLIEIQNRERFAVRLDIMSSVDALLRDIPLPPEIRTRGESGEIQIEKAAPVTKSRVDAKQPRRGRLPATVSDEQSIPSMPNQQLGAKLQTIRIYAYGVARNRLTQAAKRLGVPAVVVQDVSEANVLVTLRTYYRNREKTVIDAEQRGMPIYVLRANTVAQVEQFLGDLYNIAEQQQPRDAMDDVRHQTQQAISAVLNGERWWTCSRPVSGAKAAARNGARRGIGFTFVWERTKKACEDLQRVVFREL